MGFINAVLDEAVAYGFEGGPEYSTNLVDLENGIEHRDSAWLFPKHRFSAQFDNLSDEARDLIIEVYHACRGKRHSFKFRDWNDYQAFNEPLIVPVGTTNPVQLYKTYNFGPAYTIRPIQAIEFATVTLGASKPLITGAVDTETGLFYPDAEWAEPSEGESYAWSGQFYVWVRFQQDYNAFTINSWRANTANVDIVEDKRPIIANTVPPSWEE